MRLITIKNINKKVVWAALTNSKTIVFSLLMFNFIYRLYIYFNTKLFEFSDYTGYLNAIETIRETGFIPLKSGNAVYLNSYIGYFFKYVVGSMDYYYIFNCFIGTLSSFFIYIFIIRITDNKKAGFIYLGLTSFYSEFVAISSVFYTQVIEIFLASIMINILLTLHRSKKVVPVLIYIVFIVVIINFSFFFKGTMRYLWIVFGLLAIINVKNYRIAIKYLTLTIALYSVNISIATFFPKIDYIFSTTDLNKNSTVYHLFFGHTLYGGDGGEGTFIYPENRSRFKDNYDKWLKNNNVMVPTIETLYQFEKYEISLLVRNLP